ncbi:protein-glutamate methylesterase/protein-glutamine glutaminase [Chitinivibrio alkaliphilus]|uniref:Protein-glutamate methylesterase/protein-glutamine glutaminase n=1 Tax=Chitinivibrio alkaliphilus ACht1 TaxID=1313304 RepID=U7D8F7_9BACT|nr:chemotaxis response regulator protein-glutamate methylesterase [Chitinivibrio alkaliphilus]ERP31826.1 response regulator receiver modulated CheB methylesterase [Chitinivibrio alkaliphilus ACht1]
MKRVLIVDDSLVYRTILSQIITSLEGVRLAGQARDGKDALEKIELLSPDLITLDVEMPVLDGIKTLKIIKERWPHIPVIMLSSTTRYGKEATIRALDDGAFSFIAKPDTTDDTNQQHLTDQLQQTFAEILLPTEKRGPDHSDLYTRKTPVQPTYGRPEILAVGCSTGGPKALGAILPNLPKDLPVPMVITQHMPAGFTTALATSLDTKCALTVKEGEDGEPLRPGYVYIAPGGRHMKVGNGRIRITNDPPEHHCRPSVDYLFRSIAQEYGDRVMAIILTGMGRDGTAGLEQIQKKGRAKAIGQDKATSTVFGMPREAYKAGHIDQLLPLDRIAAEILRTFSR